MNDPGFNREGWHEGPWAYNPYGYGLGYPGGWAEAAGPFAAPEGYGWYDMNGGPPNPYNPFGGCGPQGGGWGDGMPWGYGGGYPQGFGGGYGYGGGFGGGFDGGWGFGGGGGGGGGGYCYDDQGQPPNDGGRPAINLRNEYGGIGLPPGTNYHFPSEHCIVYELVVQEPPWRNQHHGQMPVRRHMVPVNTNVKTFMTNMGCTNEDDKKNVMYELVRAGDGRWYKGIVVKMDDKDKMKKTMGDFMWGKSRNGIDDEAVFLYFTKD